MDDNRVAPLTECRRLSVPISMSCTTPRPWSPLAIEVMPRVPVVAWTL